MLKRKKPLEKGKGLKKTPLVAKRSIMKKSPIKKKQKSVEKIQEEKEEGTIMKLFMQTLWEKLPTIKKCWGCGGRIYGDNLTIYWDHLLEKSLFPQFKYEEKNMFFCCFQCHTKKGNGFPVEEHRKAIEKAKQELLWNEN